MRIIFLLGVLICGAFAEQVPFRPCKSGNTVLAVVIDPCFAVDDQGWTTCVFEHGTTVKVEAPIVAPFDASKLETVASATVNGHMIPFTNSGTNACFENVSPPCPIKSGRVYVFNFKFEILKYYPTGHMEIGFAIKDRESKQTVACIKLPIVVQRNPKLQYKQ